MTMAEDFHEYRQSLLKEYGERGKPYTETDIASIIKFNTKKPQLNLKLMVKLLKPSHSQFPEAEVPERERFPVLEGLQKYPGQQVLLVGRPGSGKSTTLERLLWEKAKGEGEIPVLVELRSYHNSTLDCIRRFFAHHGLHLSEAEIEDLLEKKKLFLLFDGLNELPSKEARDEISQFRQQYSQLTAIFTTRELSAGGDLGIQNRLEMEPLTEEQIKEFVSAYLPETGDELLQKLDPRLADIRQTPLFLWILCEVFKELKEVPENAGMLLRYFALQQDKVKKDVKVEKKLRDRAPQLLQALAVAMMSKGERKEDLRLEIPLREAKNVLKKTLKQLGIKKRDNRSKKWLQNLLSYHLIQLKKDGTRELVQFRHQLIQEYYAAEWLLKQLSNLKDDFLQHHYLNYVKWTEAIALMLNLSEDRDREQILRVVKLALEVDLQLGARLAGEVQKQFQQKTVELVWACEVPLLVKIELLKKTKSEKAIGFLSQVWKDSNEEVLRCAARVLSKYRGFFDTVPTYFENRRGSCSSSHADYDWLDGFAAYALGNDRAVELLINALNHSDHQVRCLAAEVLGEIGDERAVEPLINALNDSDHWVRRLAAEVLGQIGDDRAVEPLITALNHSYGWVRDNAARALGQIGDERAVEPLINALNDSDHWVRRLAAEVLGQIGDERAVEPLITALNHSYGWVRDNAARALGEIGDDRAVEPLINALNDSHGLVRSCAAEALGKIGDDRAVEPLINALINENALNDSSGSVHYRAAKALGKIRDDRGVEFLINALNHSNNWVRSCAAYVLGYVLGETGSETAVEPLINALNDHGADYSAAEALGKIGDERAVEPLINALNDSDDLVRGSAAEALGKIGDERAVEPLINALNDSKYGVRAYAARALGKIGDEKAVEPLIYALNDSDGFMLGHAAYALGEIGDDGAVEFFINARNGNDLEHEAVRLYAARALGEIGDERAVEFCINALIDPGRWSYRWSYVVETLEKIAYPELLPRLIKFIPTTAGIYILGIITAIQKRCNYYNYQIFHSKSPRTFF